MSTEIVKCNDFYMCIIESMNKKIGDISRGVRRYLESDDVFVDSFSIRPWSRLGMDSVVISTIEIRECLKLIVNILSMTKALRKLMLNQKVMRCVMTCCDLILLGIESNNAEFTNVFIDALYIRPDYDMIRPSSIYSPYHIETRISRIKHHDSPFIVYQIYTGSDSIIKYYIDYRETTSEHKNELVCVLREAIRNISMIPREVMKKIVNHNLIDDIFSAIFDFSNGQIVEGGLYGIDEDLCNQISRSLYQTLLLAGTPIRNLSFQLGQ